MIRLIRKRLSASFFSQAEAIERLTREVEALRADNAALRAKLDLPPKTPENSNTPPSQGHKASGEESKTSEGKRRKPRAGAHRPLHPNPTAKRDVFASSCQHCGAFFLESPQFVCEAYDHIEIPPIVPHVTRVSLLGGACLCCARKFKAEPPQDMPKGSPFGPNLRALVIYLRFTQGIAFERLATLLSDLLGLDISEGALVNILDAAKDTAAIRAKLLDVRSCNPTRPACGSASRTGGCGFSIMTTTPFSSPHPPAPRKWWRISLVTSGPISGCRTAMAGKWAGQP